MINQMVTGDIKKFARFVEILIIPVDGNWTTLTIVGSRQTLSWQFCDLKTCEIIKTNINAEISRQN